VPSDTLATPMLRRLRLDLRAAREVGAELAPDYEQLLRDDPYDPTARHRLAQLAMRRGDLATAERHLDSLLIGWPEGLSSDSIGRASPCNAAIYRATRSRSWPCSIRTLAATVREAQPLTCSRSYALVASNSFT
jgi:hypothetical protein